MGAEMQVKCVEHFVREYWETVVKALGEKYRELNRVKDRNADNVMCGSLGAKSVPNEIEID